MPSHTDEHGKSVSARSTVAKRMRVTIRGRKQGKPHEVHTLTRIKKMRREGQDWGNIGKTILKFNRPKRGK